MKRIWSYYIYLFLVWGSFRYFIGLPVVIEEMWFKPLIWLVPLFWWNLALTKRVVMFGDRWLETLTWGLGLAIAYWVLIRRLNFGLPTVTWQVMGVSLATAITEELVFCGFITGYLEQLVKNNMTTNILVGLMAAFLRLPILFFVYRVDTLASIGVFVLVLTSTALHSWIRQRSGNVTGSIVARWGLNLSLLG